MVDEVVLIGVFVILVGVYYLVCVFVNKILFLIDLFVIMLWNNEGGVYGRIMLILD